MFQVLIRMYSCRKDGEQLLSAIPNLSIGGQTDNTKPFHSFLIRVTPQFTHFSCDGAIGN